MSDKNCKEVGKKTLFTIGEMARLFHMNIRTLRYYDEIGVLKPEYVNEETNYRYYSTVQFERLNTIKYLRALDVPLEKILIFLNEKEVSTILSIFEEQRERVLKKREQLSRIEKKITNRMEQIEAALTAPYGQVIVKQIPQREIVLLEKKITREEDLEPLIRDISKKTYLDDAIFLGKVGVSVSQEDLKNGEFKYFSSIFVILEDEDDFMNKDVVLQEGVYATVRYRGTHEEASSYYAMLLNYLMDSGLHIKGDSIEITMIDAGMTNDHNQYVTELQIPI
ncbi:MerR family transcriptional regulator [Lacrimispora algidixylanolytica]|uniref:GntR family transcriptional regulator n=1 Tax=Lacrimispora algidixylanolytica TaxID=94868 RepID=A0A419SW61_9FIRM|nr:MerR family transcriptional regulator [Lacrimispora algidixylanolytica]RKD29450.1 GntR family transcriptional regulator [Lacrimispora algidixylanolytica]